MGSVFVPSGHIRIPHQINAKIAIALAILVPDQTKTIVFHVFLKGYSAMAPVFAKRDLMKIWGRGYVVYVILCA